MLSNIARLASPGFRIGYMHKQTHETELINQFRLAIWPVVHYGRVFTFDEKEVLIYIHI